MLAGATARPVWPAQNCITCGMALTFPVCQQQTDQQLSAVRHKCPGRSPCWQTRRTCDWPSCTAVHRDRRDTSRLSSSTARAYLVMWHLRLFTWLASNRLCAATTSCKAAVHACSHNCAITKAHVPPGLHCAVDLRKGIWQAGKDAHFVDVALNLQDSAHMTMWACLPTGVCSMLAAHAQLPALIPALQLVTLQVDCTRWLATVTGNGALQNAALRQFLCPAATHRTTPPCT